MQCETTQDNNSQEVEITSEQYNSILEFQQKILQMIASRENAQDILDTLCKQAEQLLPNSVASIMLVDSKTKLLNVISAPSVPPVGHDALKNLKPGRYAGSCGNAVFQNSAQYVQNTFEDDRWRDLKSLAIDFNLCSCWSNPIRNEKNNPIGSFALSSFEHRSPALFHKKLLEIGASIVNIVLKNKDDAEKISLFSNAMQNASDGIILTNKENRIIDVNNSFLETYGYTKRDLIGKNPKIFASSKNTKKLYQEMWSSLKKEHKWSGEVINLNSKGEEVIQWISICSLKEKNNYLAIFTDLTELTRIQKELSKEKSFLQTLYKGLPDLIWLKDTNGHYISCNSRFEEFCGTKEEDIVGKTDFDFADAELANSFRENDKKVITSKNLSITEEVLTFAKDGHTEIVETTKLPMMDELGKIIGVLGVARDISKRKQAEDELVKLSLAVEQSSSVIIICDSEGDIEYANRSFFDVFTKYNSLEELQNEHLKLSDSFVKYPQSNYIQEEMIDGVFWIEYLKSNSNKVFNVAIQKEDSLKHFIIKVTQTIDANDSFLVIELNDITQDIIMRESLKENEKLFYEQSKMASMGEMIGNIAHQWRQPLSVISTGVTGMQMQKEYGALSDDIFMKTCQMINKNAQYLSKTIDDFRNFIKGDRVEKKFQLVNTIESFLHLVTPTVKKYALEMIIDCPDNLIVTGYENEIIQCFINIFNNAKDVLRERTEPRYLFISVKEQEKSISISIKDNGGGIDTKIISKVFEPYFTTKHRSQGTGLGLSMTYKLIVEGMNGKIQVANESFKYKEKEYKGANFTIMLPKK